MSQSLFPQPPFCELDSLPQPSTKSRLDVSCSFLLLHWGDVGQPLLRATARPSHQAANIPTLLKTWALQNPHIPQPLLSPVFQCLPCTREHCWHLLLASHLAGCLQRSGTFRQQLHLLSHKIPLETVASMDPC